MINYLKYLLIIILFPTILCCQKSDNSPAGLSGYTTIQAFQNLSFNRPVDLQVAKDGSNRIFVVEQSGKIYHFNNNAQAREKSLFLDISARVNDGGNEEGLLGLAFHPEFSQNGYFYVNYTASNPKRTIISRFSTNPPNSDEADPGSETEIISFSQPFENHNGGQLAFGPNDGYLYIATGDGGSGGDPQNNGQILRTLLGKILRIDINTTGGQQNYNVPADNPFMGLVDASDEIYAYGLRNPWRMSFDTNGDLWAADVGQNAFEEIDLIVAGGNYGWKIMEGRHCFPATANCDQEGLIQPVWEYEQTSTDRSITGGYVYRGSLLPDLTGNYIYGDFVSGKIWALLGTSFESAQNNLLTDSNLSIASFGIDQNKELLICAFDGKIYKLTKTESL